MLRRVSECLLDDPKQGERGTARQLANAILGLRSEEHTSELQSLRHLVCRLLLEKKNTIKTKDNRDRVSQAATNSTRPPTQGRCERHMYGITEMTSQRTWPTATATSWTRSSGPR